MTQEIDADFIRHARADNNYRLFWRDEQVAQQIFHSLCDLAIAGLEAREREAALREALEALLDRIVVHVQTDIYNKARAALDIKE